MAYRATYNHPLQKSQLMAALEFYSMAHVS